MAKQREKILSSDEAWDAGQLGRDGEHAAKSEENIESQIDESLELQLISIRLQKSLIEALKHIAIYNGIGYQPLVRQILKRFVDGEIKQILRDRAYEAAEQKKKKTA